MSDEPKKTHPVVVDFRVSFEVQRSVISEHVLPVESSTSLATDAEVPIETGVFRPEFVEALSLLAAACDHLVKAGHKLPVLVGGAAVEFHTGGEVASGDFDFVTSALEAFGQALIAQGFRREDRPGRLLMGWYHPRFTLGVQVVSGALFDGKSDPNRVQIVEITSGQEIAVVPVEDLIADRLGQFVASQPHPPEMRAQALMLYRLATGLDQDYLEKRIRDETHGEVGIAELEDDPYHPRAKVGSTGPA